MKLFNKLRKLQIVLRTTIVVFLLISVLLIILMILGIRPTGNKNIDVSENESVEIKSTLNILPAFGALNPDYTDDWGKTPNNPYLIETRDHMDYLQHLQNNGKLIPSDGEQYYFLLRPNYELDPWDAETGGVYKESETGLLVLDLGNKHMEPIGNKEYPFICEFYGNGGNDNGASPVAIVKNITIINIEEGQTDNGIFGIIGEGGVVRDLNTSDITSGTN